MQMRGVRQPPKIHLLLLSHINGSGALCVPHNVRYFFADLQCTCVAAVWAQKVGLLAIVYFCVKDV